MWDPDLSSLIWKTLGRGLGLGVSEFLLKNVVTPIQARRALSASVLVLENMWDPDLGSAHARKIVGP